MEVRREFLSSVGRPAGDPTADELKCPRCLEPLDDSKINEKGRLVRLRCNDIYHNNCLNTVISERRSSGKPLTCTACGKDMYGWDQRMRQAFKCCVSKEVEVFEKEMTPM